LPEREISFASNLDKVNLLFFLYTISTICSRHKFIHSWNFCYAALTFLCSTNIFVCKWYCSVVIYSISNYIPICYTHVNHLKKLQTGILCYHGNTYVSAAKYEDLEI